MDATKTQVEGRSTAPGPDSAVRELSAAVFRLQDEHGFSSPCRDALLDLVEQAVGVAPPISAGPPPPAERTRTRYEVLDRVGEGGVGEVWRVRDPLLDRELAMKVLRAEYATVLGETFLHEARLVARLDHPAIVPVYAFGHLPAPDGRPFFTMRVIEGRTFGEIIDEVHEVGPPMAGRLLAPLRRLMRVHLAVCRAVGFAHRQGVLHRDLKPGNIMVGEHGEAYVMDWGLGQREGVASPGLGGIQGTLIYLAPELLRPGAEPSPATDIYALGAVLYHMLAGHPPYEGAVPAVIAQLQDGPPPPPRGRMEVPDALRAVCDRAMSRDVGERYATASDLAAEIEHWLDGARRMDEARELVMQSVEADARVRQLRQLAGRYRRRARTLLHGVASWAPVEEKIPGWRLQEDADALERDADLKGVESMQLLQAALMRVPDYQPALARLADRYRRAHAEAEAASDLAAAARYEVLLRNHDRTGEHAGYLAGRGRLTLHTDEPVSVELYRHIRRQRRLTTEYLGTLGRTPIDQRLLERGSYLAVLRTESGGRLRYPFQIGREAHWRSDGGDDRPPLAVAQLAPPDAVTVPAGLFVSGGDDRAYGAPLPRREVWVEGFHIDRFPVTNRAFIAFLDDLVRQGRQEEALRHAPRERGAHGAQGALVYGRGAEGRFLLKPDADGDLWEPDWPVVMVTFSAAQAYARWRASRDGLPWRLPWELEWEKAARGVDGRNFPWGGWMDPTWCNMRESRPSGSRIATVGTFPIDESPYGVRGMAGNVYDWCLDDFSDEGPEVEGQVWRPRQGSSHLKVIRGGSWDSSEGKCRSAYRSSASTDTRSALMGFRLVCSVGSSTPFSKADKNDPEDLEIFG